MKYIVYIDNNNNICIVNKETMREYIYRDDGTYRIATDWSRGDDELEGRISFDTYLSQRTIPFLTEVEMNTLYDIKEVVPELFL